MKRGLWLIVALASLCVYAQRNGTTTLLVQVRPEASLTPQQITLHFRVSDDGTSDVTTQTETVFAWVRSLPGQPIHITARPAASFGVAWSGAVTRATQGAQSASCTSGTLGSAPQDLVTGWTRSGILSCAVTFSLADARTLSPGEYTGTVDLRLSTQ